MGYFDFLIDKKNKQPKVDIEYIYLLNCVWTQNELGDKPIRIGSIMIDVVQLESGGYEFTFKETGERLRTNYGWSLAENTNENVVNIKIYDEHSKELQKVKKENKKLFNKISTLK